MAEKKLNTDLPASLTGLAVAKFRKRAAGSTEMQSDGILDGLAGALDSARQHADTALNAHRKIMGNPMKTRLDNLRSSRKVTFERVERAAKILDKARAEAMAELARIGAKTAAPPMPSKPFDVMASMVICQRLAGVDKTARNNALAKVSKNGDERVLSAVLNSPALLSGLTENELNATRHNWQSRVFADEIDRVERIRKAVAVLDIGSQALLKWADAMTDGNEIAKAEATEAEAREAMTAA